MSILRKTTLAASAFTMLLLGCDAPSPDSLAFRTLTLDVDVQLTVADGGDDDGTIIWEILEVAANPGAGETTWEVREYEPGTHPADGGDDDGTIIWEVLELTASPPGGGTTTTWELSDATGSMVCEVEDDGELRDAATGALLLQMVAGGVGDSGGSLLYTYGRETVDDARENPMVGTNPSQESATDGRQLVIAALLEGACGS